MRKKNGLPPIPWAGIETDKAGKLKEGFLHEFDFKGGKAKSLGVPIPWKDLEYIKRFKGIKKAELN